MTPKWLACTIVLLSFAVSQAQSAPKQPATFVEKIQQFFGLTLDSRSLKGPADTVVSGALWIADVPSKSVRRLTPSDNYRSPVFLAGSKDLLAIRGANIVRIAAGTGTEKKLFPAGTITRLVGHAAATQAQVLVLMSGKSEDRPRVGVLNLMTGKTVNVPYDASSSRDRQTLESLQGWDRSYGATRIYVARRSKDSFSGTVEWTDVFLQKGKEQAVDISGCDGTDCGQPSLSDDRRRIVFVRSASR